MLRCLCVGVCEDGGRTQLVQCTQVTAQHVLPRLVLKENTPLHNISSHVQVFPLRRKI